MKYLIIILFLIISCKSSDKSDEEFEFTEPNKQVYDICYKSTYSAFKDMSEKMFNSISDDICGKREGYKDKELVKLCEQACRDAYNDFKK